jgi:glycosidase
MSVPDWVRDAIFYQIFPDRFYNGDTENDPPNLQPWGAEPTYRGFQGGDLRGIIDKFDYLLDLGITALYLNPIFTAASNHRYNTHDYYTIDPTLGTMEDFHALLDAAHSNQIRVVLDGVFNHCGRGFFAFNDLLENGPDSRYVDWFHIHNYPLEAYSEGKSTSYAAWWGNKDLPQFNASNPDVRRYLMDVSRYWIEQGMDGWRLDVPAEIDDDDFWAEFRQVVKTANPDAYTVGEIWDGDPRWVGDSHFDGLMHYPLRRAILSMLTGKLPVSEFAGQMEAFPSMYPLENLHAMYVHLGSHDTRRVDLLWR